MDAGTTWQTLCGLCVREGEDEVFRLLLVAVGVREARCVRV